MSDNLQHWTDQFNTPTLAELLSVLPAEATTLFKQMHAKLTGLDGVTHDVTWYGEPWRWTVTYHTEHSEEHFAVLVPNPEDLQLAMPLDRNIADALADQRLKRTILDGLEMARSPFDTRWSVWSISTSGMIDDLDDLATQKLNLISNKGKAAS